MGSILKWRYIQRYPDIESYSFWVILDVWRLFLPAQEGSLYLGRIEVEGGWSLQLNMYFFSYTFEKICLYKHVYEMFPSYKNELYIIGNIKIQLKSNVIILIWKN